MSALWAAITILYINGEAQRASIVPSDSEQECKQGTADAMKELQPQMPKDTQLVVKCVDLNQLPTTGSVFGQK